MPNQHIISKQPQIFKRSLQTTVRGYLYHLIATSPSLDSVGHLTRVVSKRCSNTTRYKRFIAAPCIPFRTIYSTSTTQTALMESVSGQCFGVSVLTMQRSIFHTLQPSNFIVHPVRSVVCTVLAERTNTSL